MSARASRRRRTRFEAMRAQRAVADVVLVAAARRRRLHLVFHGWRSWRLAAGGRWPWIGRAVYAWTVRVGPLELRRLAS